MCCNNFYGILCNLNGGGVLLEEKKTTNYGVEGLVNESYTIIEK